MGERRLIEIATEICKSEDPLWTMGYVSSLNDSDIYLLFRYINCSTYSGMNLYDALFNFAHKYLKSKDIVINPDNVEEKQSDDRTTVSMNYAKNMFAGDNVMQPASRRI